MTFELAHDGETIEQYFDQMVGLHKQRWAAVGKAGSFAPRHAEFHRSMARLLVPIGAVVLARLSALEGSPFAVVYGHRVGEKVYCYQQGVAPESKALRSPGTAAWLLLMRSMVEQGVTTFDHQRGLTSFKERFATGEHLLTEIRITKPTLRYLASTMGELAKRATVKVGATLQGVLVRRTTNAGICRDRPTPGTQYDDVTGWPNGGLAPKPNWPIKRPAISIGDSPGGLERPLRITSVDSIEAPY